MNIVDLPLLTGWKAEAGTVEVDPYVPLRFEAALGAGGTSLLLIRDVGSDTLLEFTIDTESGRLRGATIVNLARALEKEDESIWRLPRVAGLPVVALHGRDDAAPVQTSELTLPIWVAAGADSVLATFGDEFGDKLLCVGKARFLFSRDRLIGFGAEGLSPEEMHAGFLR